MQYSDINAYLRKVTPRRDAVLRQMEQYARRHRFPIIGPLVGRVLYQLTVATRAKKILELGSGFGYSAYWFSLAAGARGNITMIDGDEENRRRALAYFDKGAVAARIKYLVGDAVSIARGLSGVYDIILNDIDKHEYPATIDVAAGLLKPGGLFITDNVLWSGRVIDGRQRDRNTRGIRTFTRKLYADVRFFTTILPIRDGIAVALRVPEA